MGPGVHLGFKTPCFREQEAIPLLSSPELDLGLPWDVGESVRVVLVQTWETRQDLCFGGASAICWAAFLSWRQPCLIKIKHLSSVWWTTERKKSKISVERTFEMVETQLRPRSLRIERFLLFAGAWGTQRTKTGS